MDVKEDKTDEQRSRTMTQKGLEYTLEMRKKERHRKIKALNKISKTLQELIQNDADVNEVSLIYTKWTSDYDQLLDEHDSVQTLFTDLHDQHTDSVQFQDTNVKFLEVKNSAQQWILLHKKPDNPIKPASVIRDGASSKFRAVSTTSSHLSAAKLKEETKKAELLARAKALEEKRSLEQAKLQLKFREEELEIKTEIQISDAKSRVIDELEKSIRDDEQFEKSLIYNEPIDEQATKVKFKDEHLVSELDPTVPSWNPESRFAYNPYTSSASHDYQTPSARQLYNFRSLHNENNGVPNVNYLPIARELNKPKADIQKFDGNPMTYKRFVRQFDSRIIANTESYEERLNFLLQFTVGEPHRIVTGFSHLDAQIGYEMTLREFNERYGDPDVIAHSYVKRAMNWPQIKPENAKGLDEFAIFLQECLYAVNCVEAVKVLEYSENLKHLVKKLPFNLHEKWRSIVYDMKIARKSIQFENLVDFVKREAKKANDPIYGRDVLSTQATKRQETIPKSRTDGRKFFATSSSEVVANNISTRQGNENNNQSNEFKTAFTTPCYYCEDTKHSLSTCNKLLELSLKDRYAFLKSKGLCFACLRYGHQKSACQRRIVCSKCNKNHPFLLHVEPRKQNTDDEHQNDTKTETTIPKATTSTTYMGAGDVLVQALPILPVRIKHIDSDKFVETYAFLDSGSNATFCSKQVMHRLNLRGKNIKLNLKTMGHQDVKDCTVFSALEISDLNGNYSIPLPQVYLQETLPVSEKDIVSVESVEKVPYLSDVKLQRINDCHVGLLIGVNVPRAMEPWNVIPSVNSGPFAVETLLGWVINGPISVATDGDNQEFVSCNRVQALHSVTLDEQVRNSFNHDFNERIIDDVESPSREDKRFLDLVSKSIHLEDGHYVVSLPFKSSDNVMPNNRTQAMQRLTLLGKRFDKDKIFRDDYVQFMDKLLTAGHAEKVPQSNLSKDDGRVWYLPHHGVYHPKKKKLRVVFDCAARFKGTSLNDRLLQGPNLTSSLIGTLLRFRQDEIAIMGDIDSMFHQVRLPKCDSDYLRFLWWENGDPTQVPVEYQMTVHIFGATSSPSCVNFALRKTAEDGRGSFGESVIEIVFKNFYVDDCLKSVKTVEDGMQLVSNLRSLLNRGGFNIAKWISNSREVVRSIPLANRANTIKDMDLDQQNLPIDRALGVSWCIENDKFVFMISVNNQPKTRRGILSMTSSVYDPLGFLAPFMLPAKLILQDLCKSNLGWDDQISTEHEAKWCNWMQNLQKLSSFTVMRCLKPCGFGDVTYGELHHFSDASEAGYGVVTYLRLVNNYGDIHCSFVIGKSRVCPLKQTTIPRLELTAATVAVRTNKLIMNELEIPIERSIFWTDSMSVLRYIWNTSARFQTFVANRLAVIHEGSEVDNWRYINTKLNPADHASRGVTSVNILEDEWISAPAFLWLNEDAWPKLASENSKQVSCSDPEVKHIVSRTDISKSSNNESKSSVMKLIEYHSSWTSLKRNVAWILKVREILLQRARAKKQNQAASSRNVNNAKISLQDLENAEQSIIKFIQRCEFQDEIDTLSTGKGKLKLNSSIRKLDPILDDGKIRVGGRLVESKMPEEQKHPLIIPKHSPVVILILRHIHVELHHCGRNQLISRLREKYWIPNAPSLCRKLISRCVTCRRVSGPISGQKMANLPPDRVTPDDPPFTTVGVDYFGPFEVKQRRCRLKRYGVIFTCMASRAVHLEVAASLDTSSYINVLRRFIARRGQVTKMRSDNGTNFVGAERELRDAISEWNLNQIEQSMINKGIEWQFNPPAGSHFGGVWERLIRSVRKAMNSVLREQVLDDDGLQTLMCEIESTLNDRPITMNSDSPHEPEPLTPNHILLLKRKPNLPPGVFTKSDNYCRRGWRQIQYMADLFWHRWVREYLPLLQERHKWNRDKRNLMIGDVVIVVDANAPRNSWPIGIVQATLPDKHGFVRQVKVKVGTNTLTRPVDKLCVILECDD